MNSVAGTWPEMDVTSSFGSVEIKQELMEMVDNQFEPQPQLDRPEEAGFFQLQAAAHQNLQTVPKSVNQLTNLVRPFVRRCTGKISVQDYRQRRNIRALHSFPNTLRHVSTTAEQNTMPNPQANMVSLVQNSQTQSVNLEQQPSHDDDDDDDDDETSSIESNDSGNAKSIESVDYSNVTAQLNDIVPMEATAAGKQKSPKKIHFIVAFKSPLKAAPKQNNNVESLPAEENIEISDDDMDDGKAVKQPAAKIQAPKDSKVLRSAPAQKAAPKLNYCTTCNQQLANSKTFRKHLKTLKHASNLTIQNCNNAFD